MSISRRSFVAGCLAVCISASVLSNGRTLKRRPKWLQKLRRTGTVPVAEIPGYLTLEDIADACLAEGVAVHIALEAA